MPSADIRQPELGPFVLPRERAAAKLRAGRPLLHDEPVRLDLAFAADGFVRLAAERGVDVGRLDLSALLTEAFVQHADHVRQLASVPGVDVALAAELASQAVVPLRRAYADRLRSFVHDWHRGYCAICGASPQVVLDRPASTWAGGGRGGNLADSTRVDGDALAQPRLGDDTETAASEAMRREVHCEACGLTWQADSVEPAYRIELALPDEDA